MISNIILSDGNDLDIRKKKKKTYNSSINMVESLAEMIYPTVGRMKVFYFEVFGKI